MKKCKEIEDFLLNEHFDEIIESIEEGILIKPSKFDMLRRMDEYSSYAFSFDIDNVINTITTIDFSKEDKLEKIKNIPDLSEFTNLEEIILTNTSIKKLSDDIQKQADEGKLKIIW